MRKLVSFIICLLLSISILGAELTAWTRDDKDENIYNNPFTYTTVRVHDKVSENEAMFNRFVFGDKSLTMHETIKKDIIIQGNKKSYYDYDKMLLYVTDFEYNYFAVIVLEDFKSLKDSYDSIRILFKQIKERKQFWTKGAKL